MEATTRNYNYYAENITRVVLEHGLIEPDERTDFESYVRGF